MRVRLKEDLCVGHGRCYELAPEVYGDDEHGHCVLKMTEVPAELREKARLGEKNCPEGALFIDED